MTDKDTRTALLDVAEQAARARGFDGFSYADLAEAVGIRKASIHYHFPSKADLSAALMDRYHATMQRACSDIEANNRTAADRLRALITLYRDALHGGATMCLCVAFVAGRESLSPEVVSQISAFRNMMASWLTVLFELGAEDQSIAHVGDPEEEARATLALLEGAHIAARAEQDVQRFDQAVLLLQARC